MKSKNLRSLVVVGGVGGVFTALCVGTAYADMLGADLPLLTSIIVNTTDTVAKINEQLAVLKEGYEKARQVAGLAQDARDAVDSFQRFNAGKLVERSADRVFPDIGYFRNELARSRFGEGRGELSALLTSCVRASTQSRSCSELDEVLSVSSARSALEVAFGKTPGGAAATEVEVVDSEAALAVAVSSSDVARNREVRRVVAEDLAFCERQGLKAGFDVAACKQAASAQAQLEQLRQAAFISDQLAEANHLQALRLAQENARRKRELQDAAELRELVRQAGSLSAPSNLRLKTESSRLLEGEK